MDTIKIIRNMHADFKSTRIARLVNKYASVRGVSGMAETSTTATASNLDGMASTLGGLETPPLMLGAELGQSDSIVEVCAKTKSNLWVVGRRATQSHREFFLLVDKVRASHVFICLLSDVCSLLSALCSVHPTITHERRSPP
jgi:hypothetical protein